MSGGRSTVAHAKGKRLSAQAGDISCVHPAGAQFIDTFLCECKFYADLNYTGLLSGTGNLLQFWRETCAEGARYNKLPFLIAKQNRLPTIIFVNPDGRRILKLSWHNAIIVAPTYGMWGFEQEWLLNHATPPAGNTAPARRRRKLIA